jgi:exoribonuclease II
VLELLEKLDEAEEVKKRDQWRTDATHFNTFPQAAFLLTSHKSIDNVTAISIEIASRFSTHSRVIAELCNLTKQNVIALSSTEAEYIAQMHAAKEALWLRK